MPFFCANFSHLVGSRGLGSGLARGSGVVGGGSVTVRPMAVESLGSCNKAFSSACGFWGKQQ